MYRTLMRDAFDRLAPVVQRFHDLSGQHVLLGEVTIDGPENSSARILAAMLGAPTESKTGALRFELIAEPDQEVWTRHFPGKTMCSTLRKGDGVVIETLGVATLRFVLVEHDGTLKMKLARMSAFGIPLPRFLMPSISAVETGVADRFNFDVQAHMPLIGLVARYRGFLIVP